MGKIKLINPPKCAWRECDNLVEKSNGEWKKYCCKDCGKKGGKENKIATFNKNFGVDNPENRKDLAERRKIACLELYGVENPKQLEEVKEKSRQTNLKKYGVEYPQSLEVTKNKVKQTNIEKYGVDVPLKSPIILEKMKQTNIERYGCEWTSQNPIVKEKQERTNIERYGFKTAFKNKDIIQKTKNTCLERYGVDNPTKNIDILEKALTSGRTVKLYTLPSGRILKLRGYEPLALDVLLQTYTEDQIITDIKLMPEITYFDGVAERKYYPDIYIPSKKLFIEVKSEYTYAVDQRINDLKRDACIKFGFDYKFMIIINSTNYRFL